MSNFDRDQLDRVRAVAPVASLQPPYSLIRREVESELLPYCAEHGVGVLAYSPLGSGLLTGAMTRERVAALPDSDWRKTKSLDFQDPRLGEHLALADRLRQAGKRLGATPAQLAVRWVLRSPVVTGAIVGARRPEQLDEVIGATDLELDPSELDAF